MPDTVATPSLLDRTTACLGSRNADVARKLAATEPRGDVAFTDTPQGVPAVAVAGTPLCSRHRPLEEAARLVERVDLVEHAVVVVLGFGAGYHVRTLAERLGRAGVIVVFEPDLGLLRAVLERIDHTSWLKEASVLFVTDATDRGALASKLEGAESIIAQGVAFLEHPPSRPRIGGLGGKLSTLFGEIVTATKTTFLTTLMRSVDTVRNLLLNFDHYAAGAGVADLEGAAAGHPAVVVSAGPSLRRNLHLLAQPGIRDRCVILAAQTTLRPLLAAGARPHFVTALDYHEISRRFYEGISADDVADTTLVADPKAHPVILDAFPGPVRCCANEFLDNVLGDLRRPMGKLPAGATVAHLAVYTAKYLGCDPIVMIGQDLAFSDGLYYAPGTAIEEVWAPELNPFNTIEMMQWQRIARHRLHLSRVRDADGKSIYTDTQMLTYLAQFERDFAQYGEAGIEIIDATEGGIPKQHTVAMPLAEVLDRYARRPLPALPVADRPLDPTRLDEAGWRVESLRREVEGLQRTSKETMGVIQAMLRDQADAARMQRHFRKLDRCRRQIDQQQDAVDIVNYLNQLGVYKRFKADRRLHMQRDLDPMQRQRAQLERDLENVTWTADAAREIGHQLDRCRGVLAGDPPAEGPEPSVTLLDDKETAAAVRAARIAALVPLDPDRNGLGVARSLAEPFAGRPVLQATLERLGASSKLESIILIAPRDFDVEALIDRSRIGRPVIVEPCDGSPFGPGHAAIAAARRWSATCWRGGIAGMSVYDEVLCPGAMSDVMQRRGITAGLVVGPDWPLVDVSGESGCDAIAVRHLELPQQHKLVFTQAPPGLCGCLVSAGLMQELALGNRLSTIGGLLVYQPHAPQSDPISRTANVQIDHRVRRSRIRATYDAPRYRARIEAAGIGPDMSAAEVVAALERDEAGLAQESPQHLVVELCGDDREMPLEMAEKLLQQVAEADDAVVTFSGATDPLQHPRFDEILRLARDAGILGVHVRTALTADQATLDRLLACDVDVVSVDLNAVSAETYRRVTGRDDFGKVIGNVEYLVNNRRRLTEHPPAAALALPWIVPRIRRQAESYEDIDGFFERWQASLGTAVIDPPASPDDGLLPTEIPPRVREDQARRTTTVLSDGTVRGH
jgi:pyruvate-formate lyase-activating enzyme